MTEWTRASDPEVVHALIEESDRRAAARSGSTLPRRNPASTRRLVEAGAVWLALADEVAVATVTVSPLPSFDPADAGLVPAERPWYMQRLALGAASVDPLLGLRAVRHAVEVARAGGADTLRAEANPDLADVLHVLTRSGFTRGSTDRTGAAPRTYLQRAL